MAVSALASHYSEFGYDKAFAWVRGIDNTQIKRTAQAHMLMGWAAKDPGNLANWAMAQDFGADQEGFLVSAGEALLAVTSPNYEIVEKLADGIHDSTLKEKLRNETAARLG